MLKGCKHVLVTGAAGFIGSNLVDHLLGEGYRVTGVDDLSTGSERFLADALTKPTFSLIQRTLCDERGLEKAFAGVDFVFHLAANADVRFGLNAPKRDLEQNTIVTFNVLEAMRKAGVGRIAFSSTGSIYGEPDVFPTPETAPFPVQTSLYGASKLACEGLIQAYASGFGVQAWIFRFVSVLGERYTHGHVIDFFRQLQEHPEGLHVLGDGRQRKSYMHVSDCIGGMLHAIEHAQDPVNVFNLGADAFIEVNDSIGWILEELGLEPEITYGGGARGWVGDSPFIYLDTTKLQSLGWATKVDLKLAVQRTVAWLRNNAWALKLADPRKKAA